MNERVEYAKGNRMSSLPITQYCSGAAKLGTQSASGRPAIMSSAFHANAASQPNAGDLLAMLTDKERAEIGEWFLPTDVTLDDGTILRYAEATCEQTVHLTSTGEHTDNVKEAMCTGHPDFFWIRTVTIGDVTIKVAFIGDLKKSDFSSPDGLRSLSLMAYGFAVAGQHDCDAFAVGLFNITLGEWNWSDIIELGYESAEILHRIQKAATNLNGEFVIGTHCQDCFNRGRCPQYLLPVVGDPVGVLAPLAKPGGLTPDNALEVLAVYQRMKELTAIVKKELEAFAYRVDGIPDGEGKVWRERTAKGGKMVLNKKTLVAFMETNYPDLCLEHQIETQDRSHGYAWCNVPKVKKDKKDKKAKKGGNAAL